MSWAIKHARREKSNYIIYNVHSISKLNVLLLICCVVLVVLTSNVIANVIRLQTYNTCEHAERTVMFIFSLYYIYIYMYKIYTHAISASKRYFFFFLHASVCEWVCIKRIYRNNNNNNKLVCCYCCESLN